MCLTRSIHVSGVQRAPFRKQKFRVAGIQSETEAMRCLLWMGFHCYTTASSAEPATGDERRRWFIRRSTPTNATCTHRKEGFLHLGLLLF